MGQLIIESTWQDLADVFAHVSQDGFKLTIQLESGGDPIDWPANATLTQLAAEKSHGTETLRGIWDAPAFDALPGGSRGTIVVEPSAGGVTDPADVARRLVFIESPSMSDTDMRALEARVSARVNEPTTRIIVLPRGASVVGDVDLGVTP